MPSSEIVVQGLVQGVGFRRFVYDLAVSYGIRGYVKNQSDGTVLIICIAETEVLLDFCTAIRKGNHYAVVKDLQMVPLEGVKDYHDFSIR